MRQRTIVFICLACLLMAGKAAAAKSSDDIALMPMHLECGWLEQLSSGSDELNNAARYHIVAGAELAADVGLKREELADEVSAASRRVFEGSRRTDYLGERFSECRGSGLLD